MKPQLSSESWKAAVKAATAAIPVLIAKGLLEEARVLYRKTEEFKRRAGS